MKARMSVFVKLRLLALAVLALGFGVTFCARADADGYYMIQNKLSGLYLDIQSASSESGASLIIWTRNGRANQQYYLE